MSDKFISLTQGRIVWYVPLDPEERLALGGQSKYPAMVVRVRHDERIDRVDLQVFSGREDGSVYRGRIDYSDSGLIRKGGSWHWPR